jgi:phage-related minor tail protein
MNATSNKLQPLKFRRFLVRHAQVLGTALVVLATATASLAQGNGAAGIQEATAQVTSYFDPATTLIYAIGAVVGLVGAVKVFSKWNSGDQDTQKTAMSWFGSCIFLVVVATVLRAFFL